MPSSLEWKSGIDAFVGGLRGLNRVKLQSDMGFSRLALCRSVDGLFVVVFALNEGLDRGVERGWRGSRERERGKGELSLTTTGRGIC